MEQTLNEIKDEKDNSEKENIEEIISKNTSKDDIAPLNSFLQVLSFL